MPSYGYNDAALKALGARGATMARAYTANRPISIANYATLMGQRANAMARAYGFQPGKTQAPAYFPPVININQPGSASGTQAVSYNWQNDPYLLETKAMAGKNRAEAEAVKNDQLRKLILQRGVASLAEKLFPGDAAYIQSVRDNPFSDFGEIKHAYEGVQGLVNQTNEDLNKDNLFFSSYRTGQALPEVYRQRQSDEYQLTNLAQSGIDTVNAAYASRLEEIRLQELQAERDAWLQAMLSGAQSGAGPSSAGTPAVGEPYITKKTMKWVDEGGLKGKWVEVEEQVPNPDYRPAVPGTVAAGGVPYGGSGGQYTHPDARPGEVSDLPLAQPWNPIRNADATYDMSGATWNGSRYVGPTGLLYDENGRRV